MFVLYLTRNTLNLPNLMCQSIEMSLYRDEDAADAEEVFAESLMEAFAVALPSADSVSIHPSAREVACNVILPSNMPITS